MNEYTCDNCQRPFSVEELPIRGSICFRCHLKGVNLGFTWGKATFHGPTIKEQQDKQMADAAVNGLTIEKVSTRKTLI